MANYHDGVSEGLTEEQLRRQMVHRRQTEWMSCHWCGFQLQHDNFGECIAELNEASHERNDLIRDLQRALIHVHRGHHAPLPDCKECSQAITLIAQVPENI